MSENPNPTVCGNCHTENPPNAEYCNGCGAALTLVAEQAQLEPDASVRQDPLLDTRTPADVDEGTKPAKPSGDQFPTD
jgi:predicted amidophosphoribosyltransferase